MSDLMEQSTEIEELVIHQLRQHWKVIDEYAIHNAIPGALESIEKNFNGLPMPRFYSEGKIRFSPYMSVQWMIFLYRLSHEIYCRGGV